jgi:hypothetical protein
LNAGGFWRWAFREKGDERDEAVFDRFWHGLLCRLLSAGDFSPGHDVALRSDRRLYTDEQPMRFLIRTRCLAQDAYRPKLKIRPQAGGEAAEIEPHLRTGGTYAAEAGPFPPGLYDITLVNNVGRPAELTQTLAVIGGSVEQRVLSADPDLLRRLAELSEGAVVNLADLPQLGEITRQWRAHRQLSEQKESLWDRWWIAVAIITCLGLEWRLRRREGLP